MNAFKKVKGFVNKRINVKKNELKHSSDSDNVIYLRSMGNLALKNTAVGVFAAAGAIALPGVVGKPLAVGLIALSFADGFIEGAAVSEAIKERREDRLAQLPIPEAYSNNTVE